MLSLLVIMVAVVLLILGVLVGLDHLVRKNLHRWLPAYIRHRSRRRDPAPGETVHLIVCLADHFEPDVNETALSTSRDSDGSSDEVTPELEMVQRWARDYPRLFGAFRDSDGRPPRHTFFYPLEEYEAAHLDILAGLCRAGYGEVEVHLHHEDDSAEELRGVLLAYKKLLAHRHGLLPVHRQTGEVKYGFIHGNWALDNSLPHGQHCGVDNELEVLRETGCYADFTLPSAPSVAQTRTINQIYYAVEDGKARSHDTGVPVGSGPAPERGLMLIQGPLLLDWQRRKLGVLPHIENGCLQPSQLPTLQRLKLWLRARVQVPTRPDWFFVKLHAHGGLVNGANLLLGEPMVQFHQALAEHARQNANFHFHYVTAREMYNLVRAAESGWQGNVAEARDFELVWPQPSAPAEQKDQASEGTSNGVAQASRL